LYNPHKGDQDQEPLARYISNYILVSELPEHTSKKGVVVFYRKTSRSQVQEYTKEALEGSPNIKRILIWSSSWKGRQPLSPIYFYMMSQAAICIQGLVFAVGKPSIIDDKINQFRGFGARILDANEYDSRRVQKWLEHIQVVICKAAEVDYQKRVVKRDLNGNLIAVPSRIQFYDRFLDALAAPIQGFKVHFETYIIGPKGLGKGIAFETVQKAVGSHHARKLEKRAAVLFWQI
jgi:hypothetical protein